MKTIKLNAKEVTPNKIVCVGRNYVEHIEELNNEIPENMVVFGKPNSAISDELTSNTGDGEQIHYEGEICFLIKNEKFVAVGFGFDLTKRGIQSKLKAKGLPWERAKAFDKAAVFSEFVSLEGIDINTLRVKLYIDDVLIQDGDVGLMMYKPENILKEISSFMSLNDDDIIMSGTPKGVGVVNSGSKYCGQILSADEVLCEKYWKAV